MYRGHALSGAVRWLVAGAGFTGAVVAERIARTLDQRVLIVDRRDHLGGNAYDFTDADGNVIHKYGPHIFHTGSDRIWEYLSQFTEWRPYVHRTMVAIGDQLVTLPFNLDSLQRVFPGPAADKISAALVADHGSGTRVTIGKLLESPTPAIAEFARFLHENVYLNYVRKQWDLEPEELSPSVLARLPVSISHDDRYFQSRHQAMPVDGYAALFERMLAHPKIEVALGTEFADARASHPSARIVYTGPIDAYFDHRHGELPYRSVRFDLSFAAAERAQPVGTISYPGADGYTRITDLSHITGQTSRSVLVKEFPEAYARGRNEPFYPVPTPQSAAMLKPYVEAAGKLRGKVWFAGRLGDYAYYNMDQACGRAMALVDKELAGAA
ncbi:UDP-galactopyranose mutase [Aurantimonas sp. 22II-16-19i]|nr:UDP-galactopyranose mutase [Aurantimonas sp. 22II-16-19i]